MNSSSRNGAKVIWLAVHTTEGMMRVQTLRDWAAWPGSSHAASDETGALWGPEKGFVPYDRASWTLRNGNPISENIEQCGWAKWSREDWRARPLLLDATARWLAERSAARGIPLRRLTHAEIRARVPGVLGHGDYSVATGDGSHWDPGPGYPWDIVLAKANAYRYGTAGGFLMALTDAEQREVLENTRANRSVLYFGGPGQPKELTVYSRVVDIQMALTNALPQLLAGAQRPGADPAAIAAAVVAAIPDDLAQDVLDGLAEKLAARPDPGT